MIKFHRPDEMGNSRESSKHFFPLDLNSWNLFSSLETQIRQQPHLGKYTLPVRGAQFRTHFHVGDIYSIMFLGDEAPTLTVGSWKGSKKNGIDFQSQREKKKLGNRRRLIFKLFFFSRLARFPRFWWW